MGCPVSTQLLLALLLLLLQLPGHLGQVTPSLGTGPSGSPLPTSPMSSTGTGGDGVAETGSPSNTTAGPSLVTSTGGEAVVTEAVEEDWSPAEAYLYSGDAAALGLATCPRSYRLSPPRGRPPPDLGPLLRPVTTSLANAANFLNLIFQASELRETSIREDLEWYHALVRSLLEGDRPGLVRRALLTFDADPLSLRPQLVLRASQGPLREIYLQDFTSTWDDLHPAPPAPDDSWFTALKFAAPPQVLAGLSKRALVNDLTTLETPKWARGDSYVANSSGACWADAAFLECEDGRFLPGWLLTLTMPFYGLKPDLSPEFRGVIRVDVNVQGYDIDQCATGDVWFADTHQCNRTSMVCEPIPGQGFRLGQYCCRCKEGFYSPAQAARATGPKGGRANGTQACYPSMPVCLPCWPGCARCEDGSPCRVRVDWLLRGAVMTVQALFMVLIFLSMLITYQNRGSKRIRASGLLLLETILFGSLLLYFPVFILFFRPSTFRCILLRWVRLLGFAIVYGTMTLKMYRVLKVFLSRTAQRVPYMSSTSLLRLLGVMVATVSWFLCAWTAGVLQNRDRNVPLLVTSTTSNGQAFNQCDIDRWDYMMALAERLFLCWGLFLCSAVKPVPSAFHEPRYMSIAIHNEMILSCMFHLLRFSHHSLHPDWTLLLEFTHTHATITVTLGLLFVPKFLHVTKPGREVIAAEVYEDEVDLRRSYLNSSFVSAWSDHVEHEDIRDELKKLYSQLEIHKTKKMANNNPHISKKRSSRLGIGRSIIKHITDFPGTISRQHSREDRSGTHSPSPSLFSASSKKPSEITYITYREDYSKEPSPNIVPKSQTAFDNTPSRTPSRTPSFAGSLTPILVDKRASQYSQHSQHSQYSQLSQHSQYSQAESLDAPPMVCKSASAHNLSVDKNFLHPDDSRQKKSLSAVVTSTDYYSLMEEAAQSGPTTPVLKHVGSIKEQTSQALLAESFDKAEVCPWEVEEERRPSKKHVTISIANDKNEEDAPAEKSPTLIICPWENVEQLPSATKQKSIDSVDSDGDSVRLKAPISSSAPVSPSATGKEIRVFSFRSTTKSLLHARGLSTDKTKLTATLSVDVAKKTPQLQKRSMTTTDLKPLLMKQNAIRLSSTESADRSPRRKPNPEVLVCPWESDLELNNTKGPERIYENVITPQSSLKSIGSDGRGRSMLQVPPRRQQSIVADVCPWEVPKPPEAMVCPWDAPDATVPQVREGSLKSNTGVPKPTERVIYVSHSGGTPEPGSVPKTQETVPAEVCPWESGEPVLKQDSAKANVCPWESGEPVLKQDSAKANVCPWESGEPVQKQDSAKANVCPWESGEPVQKQDSAKANVCPWESGEPVQKQDSAKANVCPWESGEPVQKQDSAKANVCPWESGEPAAAEDKKTSQSVIKKSPQLTKQVTVNVEACPWDSPDQPEPGKINICPWEADSPKPPLSKQAAVVHSSQESINTKTEPKQTPKLQQQHSVHANVCPWETEESSTPKDGEATKGPVKAAPRISPTLSKHSTNTAEACPWDFPAPPPPSDVCPWEVESAEPQPTQTKQVSRTSSRQGSTSSKASAKQFPKQDSVRGNVCPWEVESAEPQPTQIKQVSRTSSRQGSTSSKASAKPFPKQDSVRGNVCPWESQEPEGSTQQDSAKADVCPWETESTEKGSTGDKLKHQGSVAADVCPWETDTPKRQDSARGNVCPWETGGTEEAKADDSTAAVGTTAGQENAEQTAVPAAEQENIQSPTLSSQELDSERCNTPLERRDALCPWSTERSQHDNNSDVFTWEENIPEEDEDLDAECAAEAFVFPPDLD
ncbi:probable G-protein coupled receptor 158 [Alosa sapidissima]|uniref:probable G-protein coupled receptor 158 n=1 Tax=Alosa sapidissima TaxID=34773 RepID=UPI001C097534|nr:probable G-protein coupled receptor 158 [Alosa sapidissima]